MLTIHWPHFPPLQAGPLLLRQFGPPDAPQLLQLRSHPEVMRYLDRDPLRSLQEAAELIDKYNAAFADNTGINWAVVPAADPTTLLGNMAIWRIDAHNHRGELGYMFFPEHWGKGWGSLCLHAVLRYAFGTLGLHGLEANVNPANTASALLLTRAGFRQEAYFRQNYYYNGQFIDSQIFCILGGEYLAQHPL